MNDTIGITDYIRLNDPIIVTNWKQRKSKWSYPDRQGYTAVAWSECGETQTTSVNTDCAPTWKHTRHLSTASKNFTANLLKGEKWWSGFQVAKGGQDYNVRIFTGYVTDLMLLK